MNDYFGQIRHYSKLVGGDPEKWPKEYDPATGPWEYVTSDYWLTEAERKFEEAQERGAVECPIFADYEDPSEEELVLEAKLRSQFYPQPGTYEWY
jgi:hypothetical protein